MINLIIVETITQSRVQKNSRFCTHDGVIHKKYYIKFLHFFKLFQDMSNIYIWRYYIAYKNRYMVINILYD